jgi:hypothetical protein
MCCGNYKNDLFRQALVNNSLVDLCLIMKGPSHFGAKKEHKPKHAAIELSMFKILKNYEVKIKVIQEFVISMEDFSIGGLVGKRKTEKKAQFNQEIRNYSFSNNDFKDTVNQIWVDKIVEINTLQNLVYKINE